MRQNNEHRELFNQSFRLEKNKTESITAESINNIIDKNYDLLEGIRPQEIANFLKKPEYSNFTNQIKCLQSKYFPKLDEQEIKDFYKKLESRISDNLANIDINFKKSISKLTELRDKQLLQNLNKIKGLHYVQKHKNAPREAYQHSQQTSCAPR